MFKIMFWSEDLDRLYEDFYPFHNVYKSIDKDYIDQYHLYTYDLLALNGNLIMDNIQLFQLVIKSNWTTSHRQLDTTLKIFKKCCMLIIYPTHPFVSSCGILLDLWGSTGIKMLELFGIDPERSAQFLWSTHLIN